MQERSTDGSAGSPYNDLRQSGAHGVAQVLPLRDNSTTVSLTARMPPVCPRQAGGMWSYSPMITSRRMTTTIAMITFICRKSTQAPYTGSCFPLKGGLCLPACFQLGSRASPPPPRVTTLPQPQPCLLPVLLTLQSRHHICLRRCLALLLKAAALSDKLSVKGKKRVSSVVHTLSEHPLTCSNCTEFHAIKEPTTA